ncbi:acyl carrier protein [Paludibacterium paludis]|uniref:Carrier domain-containing protein n=1 Tax=Paludibacterium paludis TaxID=1225769 RepID=A0A918P0G4_9NEIS|nr:acyl carrier protein [Paludibacterium paludis]GGY11309.1 hypothetical protein GCM10011289_12790 [Paludibacterium paludis]
MDSTFEQHVIAALADYLGVDTADLSLDQHLENDLELDSTEFVCLLVSIEKACKVELAGLRFADMKTVRDIVAAVENRARTLA